MVGRKRACNPLMPWWIGLVIVVVTVRIDFRASNAGPNAFLADGNFEYHACLFHAHGTNSEGPSSQRTPQQDSLSSAVQIVVLATVHRPEERDEPHGPHSGRDWHESY